MAKKKNKSKPAPAQASTKSYRPGQFVPGDPRRGPGIQKGTVLGRKRALGVLDAIMGDEGNLHHLRCALEKQLRSNGYKFFRQIVMPLLPKEALHKFEDVTKSPIRILLGEMNVGEANKPESNDVEGNE